MSFVSSSFGLIAWLFLLTVFCGCRQADGLVAPQQTSATLRVGIGQVATGTPVAGLQQLRQILTAEALVNFSADGRPHPWLADGWATDPDGLTVRIRLRQNVRFHDGSPVDAPTIAKVLLSSLPQTMGAAYEDVDAIRSIDESQVEIHLRHASPFVLEALQQHAIRKPSEAPVGTGPFVDSVHGETNEIRANENYYLGRSAIDRIVITIFPSVRAAWAELLRDRLDMLYEVGFDALDSLENAKQVSVFKYTRNYQFALVFNPQATVFRSASVRRALNMAIDREAVLRDALDGRAEPSSGPVSTHHWAFRKDLPSFSYDPRLAAEILKSSPGGRGLRFVCLVPPDFERIALVVKRQLQAIGVEMDVREVSPDEFFEALTTNKFEAMLSDFLSGPTLFNVYTMWHSQGPMIGRLGSPLLDAALERVRHASNDEEYRDGVADVQRAVVEDPPGVFLAWGQRARAVSRRFEIPVEQDRDILRTLRLWRPATTQPPASRQKN